MKLKRIEDFRALGVGCAAYLPPTQAWQVVEPVRGIALVIHRSYEDQDMQYPDRWTVSEMGSGASVAKGNEGESRAVVLSRAVERLEEHSDEQIARAVERVTITFVRNQLGD